MSKNIESLQIWAKSFENVIIWNVIFFVINPSGFYSIVRADLEYPNLLCFDSGS